MMMSAPLPDWIADVMRVCRSLALTVSTRSEMPVAFLHSWVIAPLSRASDAGTKSAHRSQWTDRSSASAGARPVARMAARPPAPVKSLRRAMRVMFASRGALDVSKSKNASLCAVTTPGTCSPLVRYGIYARSTFDGASRETGHVVLDEEGVDDRDRDRS